MQPPPPSPIFVTELKIWIREREDLMYLAWVTGLQRLHATRAWGGVWFSQGEQVQLPEQVEQYQMDTQQLATQVLLMLVPRGLNRRFQIFESESLHVSCNLLWGEDG